MKTRKYRLYYTNDEYEDIEADYADITKSGALVFTRDGEVFRMHNIQDWFTCLEVKEDGNK